MTVRKAYNDWSDTYDRDRNATRDLDRFVLARVLGRSRFKAIVEIGCGTGKNTELLAQHGGSIQALDFSAGMIAKAREKLGRFSNVTFSVADITRRWPCADRSADLVVCNLVLEHVAKLAPVFSEAARVLARGGSLFVSELHPFRQYDGAVANFRRGRKTIRIPACIHHISDFLEAARNSRLELKQLQEWWHEKDYGKPPRLVSFLFGSASATAKWCESSPDASGLNRSVLVRVQPWQPICRARV